MQARRTDEVADLDDCWNAAESAVMLLKSLNLFRRLVAVTDADMGKTGVTRVCTVLAWLKSQRTFMTTVLTVKMRDEG